MYKEINKLIEDCMRGKNKAQKELFRRYRKILLGICLRYARDKQEAEDMLLEGFMNIFKNIDQFSKQGSFEGWCKKPMVHSAIDYFRKNKKELFHYDVDDFKEKLIYEEKQFSMISEKEILNQVQMLPDGYRMIFNLYVLEGFSHKEIAEKLQISEGTSRSQLKKARMRLIKMISKDLN